MLFIDEIFHTAVFFKITFKQTDFYVKNLKYPTFFRLNRTNLNFQFCTPTIFYLCENIESLHYLHTQALQFGFFQTFIGFKKADICRTKPENCRKIEDSLILRPIPSYSVCLVIE
uniref:Uncharacterized protein n=1 Tax=Cacopsylla melanoneura TaxID=428564 RepID=A0A8D8V5B9_9HEMI